MNFKPSMGQVGTKMGNLLAGVMQSMRLRKWLWIAVAAVIVFQAYFVRELLAAEILFALGFAFIAALGALAYVLGSLGEHGLDWTEAGVRFVATNARRGYVAVEDLSGRAFRRTRSQQAQ